MEKTTMLECRPAELAGVYWVQSVSYRDARGTFERVFCHRELTAQGLCADFVQMSLAQSCCRGTLRGLHCLDAAWGEDKLVRCVHGRIFDVCVDVRKASPTFGQWVGGELSPEEGRALYVPRGFAHGYLTLEDDTQVLYAMTAEYQPDLERGYRYDEPRFAIAWPDVGPLTISAKDQQWDYLT